MGRLMRGRNRFTDLAAALSLVMLGGLGCQSLSAPDSASFASVKIGGHTVEEVQATVVKIFQSEGYRATTSADGLLFEREGSRWEEIAYGSNVGNSKVINRVRAQVVELGGGVCRLQCTAYVVRDAATSIEDEVQLLRPRRGYYQGLLDQVVQNLTPVQVIHN